MDKSPITEFQGDYRWLSNFSLACVSMDGEVYLSVEHAYQASKTLSREERAAFRQKEVTASKAKFMGRKVTLRPDWEEKKDFIMRSLLKQKFAIPHYKQLLLRTTGRKLIEGNYWNDTYWGVNLHTGVGKNKLGIMIMDIRDNIPLKF